MLIGQVFSTTSYYKKKNVLETLIDGKSKVKEILKKQSNSMNATDKSGHPEVLEKGILKICSKCAGEHPCRSAISIELQSKFIEITLRQGYSPVNLLHIFRTPFTKNTCGRLLLYRLPVFIW